MLNYTIYLIENFDSQLETTIDMDKKKMLLIHGTGDGNCNYLLYLFY